MFERDRISSCASIIFKTVCRENILVRGLMVDLCRNDCTDRLGMSFSTFLRHFGAGGGVVVAVVVVTVVVVTVVVVAVVTWRECGGVSVT